jgi:ABC-type sugar transport system, periplasmic component
MSNSWVVFCLQHIRWEASLHKDVKDVIVTDAAFNPGKQVADIEDLIAKNVSLIIYWPVDEKRSSRRSRRPPPRASRP